MVLNIDETTVGNRDDHEIVRDFVFNITLYLQTIIHTYNTYISYIIITI